MLEWLSLRADLAAVDGWIDGLTIVDDGVVDVVVIGGAIGTAAADGLVVEVFVIALADFDVCDGGGAIATRS